MAQNTTLIVPANTWTQLTDANVTSITFQNTSGYYVLIKGVAGATTPTNDDGAIRYNPGQGERNVLLSDLFPGIAATRVYCYAPSGAEIMVSHS